MRHHSGYATAQKRSIAGLGNSYLGWGKLLGARRYVAFLVGAVTIHWRNKAFDSTILLRGSR